jgi:hypothetical protein
MKSGREAAALLVALLCSSAPSARAQQCSYKRDVEARCANLGCLAQPGATALPGAPGVCGACVTDDDCGGVQCSAGQCAGRKAIVVTPEPWYPHYHLAIIDAAFDVHRHDGLGIDPIFGSGYWFRGAFRDISVAPARDGRGGWEANDPPRWYFHLGASLAVVSSAQNVFAEAALFHYTPVAPLAITGYSVGALYQREGQAILKLANEAENSDRLGPALGFEFLHNLTLRVSYVLPMGGPLNYQSVMVSLIYMKSLLSDLVPQPYQKFVPDYL